MQTEQRPHEAVHDSGVARQEATRTPDGRRILDLRRLLAVGAAMMALALLLWVARPTDDSAVVRVTTIGPYAVQAIVDERTNRLFIAQDMLHRLDVLDAITGRMLRRIPLGADPTSPNMIMPWVLAPDIARGRLYIGTRDSPSVVELDAANGGHERLLNGNDSNMDLALARRSGRLILLGEADQDSILSALDAASGTLRFRTAFDTQPGLNATFTSHENMIAIDEMTNRIFAASPAYNRIHMFDARTGRLLKTVTFGQRAALLAADEPTGRIFAQTATSLLMLDARRGALLRIWSGTDYEGEIAVDESSGYLLVGSPSWNGNAPAILEMDGRSGRLLRRIPVGVEPAMMVIDARRHRLVVAGPNGNNWTPQNAIWGLSVLDEATGAVRYSVSRPGMMRAWALNERAGRAFIVSNAQAARPNPWGWLPRWIPRTLPFPKLPSQSSVLTGSVTVVDITR